MEETNNSYQQQNFQYPNNYSASYYDNHYNYPAFVQANNFNQYYKTQNYYSSFYPNYPSYESTQMQYHNSYYDNESSLNGQLKRYSTVSPPPTNLENNSYPQIQSELTPEKLCNDSGIDMISPQLNLVRDSMNFQLPQQSPQAMYYPQQLHQTQNILQTSDASTNETNETKTNQTPIDLKDTSSDYSDDEDDEQDDENDDDKENTKSKNGSNNPKKPPKPYLEIIADAILTSQVKMMQLHEIYHLMEKKYQYFAKNINKSWRNSVRHNLSLNECFVKAGRGSNGKGNYWKIHPLCEKEFIRGNFRRKSFKQLIRAGTANQLASASSHIPYPVSIDYAFNYRSIPQAPLNYNYQ